MTKWNAPEVQELDIQLTANGWVSSQEEGHNAKYDRPFGPNEKSDDKAQVS